MNIAARAARWSAANWKKATFGWLVFVIASAALGQAVGVIKLTESEQGSGGSARAQATLAHAGLDQSANEAVLVQSTGFTASEPTFQRVVGRVLSAVAATSQVNDVRSPFASGDGGQISKDGHSALVQFSMRGDPETAADRVQPVLNAVAAVQRQSPGFIVAEFGDASAAHALSKLSSEGFARAEKLSVPITFLILLVAFGAFVAAGIPVLLAFSAVLASSGLAAVASHVVHQSEATSSVMLLMGMAVGVDYSLFYLRREREERRPGHPSAVALQRAAATSGRAVLVSGFTVLIAMAGMLLTGSKVFTSLGVGAMLVVFTAMVGSLTVLPALLGRLGDKVEKGAVRRPSRARSSSRVWDLVLRPVLRYPRVAVVLSSGVLVVLALPLFGMHTSFLSGNDLPRQLPIERTYDADPAGVPWRATPGAGGRQRGARRLADGARRARADGAPGAGQRRGERADHRRASTPTHDRGRDRHPAAGKRSERGVDARAARRCASGCCRRRSGGSPASATRSAAWLRARATSTGRSSRSRPARVRLRARAGVRAAADHVPLDRDSAHVDRAEPALRRGGVRRARVDLPGGTPAEPARLPLQRRGRGVAAAVPVPGAVRSLDGLPRVHREPYQGAP